MKTGKFIALTSVFLLQVCTVISKPKSFDRQVNYTYRNLENI